MTEPSSRLKLAAGNLVPREGIGSEGSVPDEAKSNTKTADNEVDNMAEAEEATTYKAKVSHEEKHERVLDGLDTGMDIKVTPGDKDGAMRKVLGIIVPEHGDCGEDFGEQVNETQSTLKAGNKFPSLEKDPVLDLVPKWKEKMRLPGKVKRLQVKKHFQGRKLMIPAQMPRCSGHRNRNAQT